MRVVWYEYVDWRWLRYILSQWHTYQYHYENEIKLYTEKSSIWFEATK